jgi:nicotinamidase-related amidase
MTMQAWQTVFPPEERAIYEKGGFGKRQAMGLRPVLLIVDVTYSFIGRTRQNVLASIEEFRTSCGEVGWEALPRIRRVLEAARQSQVTIVFTKGDPEYKAFCGGSTKGYTPEEARRLHAEAIADEIAPRSDEFVLRKTKASAFFGTPLANYLTANHIDTVLVCGTSTSGCVRATVVDAFSYGYPVFVIEEGCFDRSLLSHRVSLYEMNAKYANVILLEEALQYLERVGAAGHPAR